MRCSNDHAVVVYLGPAYEVNATTGVTTSYYFFGGQRVAMRQGAVVYWLHGDHLGSASLTTSGSGQIVSQQRYKPYGQTRWISGTIPTDRRFTDQRSDEAGIGLYDFRARYLDPRIGRFISADTIVPEPGDPQNLNRYTHVRNNPLMFIDPTGRAQLCYRQVAAGKGKNPQTESYLCPSTGDNKLFEDWLFGLLMKTQLGKEMLANDSKLFGSVVWQFPDFEGGASIWPLRDDGNNVYFDVYLPKSLLDSVKSGTVKPDKVGLPAHEVFHVYQRRRDPGRQNIIGSMQMEREAWAFQYGILNQLTGYENPGAKPLFETADKAYSWIKDSAKGTLSGVVYSFLPHNTTHGGDLVQAFTVDLHFSRRAVEYAYGSARVKMP